LESLVYVTKRDGKCLFDQLRLPFCLRPFMGRPPVRVRELMQHGNLTASEVRSFCDHRGAIREHDLVYPRSCVWPMGFSWSSFVAQSQMLNVCRDAGLRPEHILSTEVATPTKMDCTFALATDDVMAFTRGSGTITAPVIAQRVDNAFIKHGVEKMARRIPPVA
jgi:hypothetical protein